MKFKIPAEEYDYEALRDIPPIDFDNDIWMNQETAWSFADMFMPGWFFVEGYSEIS